MFGIVRMVIINRMYLTGCIVAPFAFICAHVNAQIQPPQLNTQASNASRELDRLERSRTRSMIQDEKRRESEIRRQNNILNEQHENNLLKSKHMFFIHHISIENDDIYAHSPQRQKIIMQFLNTEMGQKEIMELVKDLTNFYVGKGYATTLVTVQPGSLREGVLKLEVLWGKIAGFSVDGNPPTFFEKTRLFSAIPFAQGNKLKMSDIDQGLDNLLRVSRTDKLQIVPADDFGYSTLDLHNSTYSPISFSVGMNNSGREDDGWHQYNSTLTVNNFSGFNDSLSVYYAYNDLHAKTDTQNSWSVNYSLPLGYWLLDASLYRSEYEKVIGGYFGGYHSEGTSQRASTKLSRVIFRDSVGKFSAYTKVEGRDNTNKIEDIKIGVSSKKYSSIAFGVTRVGTLGGGGLFWDLSSTAGVPWFGAAWKNEPDLKGFDLNYIKYNGIVSWSKALAQYGPVSLTYELNSGFQFTKDILVSDGKQSIGDEYTVRGYKESSVSGHNGGYISNTVQLPIAINKLGIWQLSPFAGYDLGFIKNNCTDDMGSCPAEYLTGAALGLKAVGNHFSTSLTLGYPLTKPSILRNSDIDSRTLSYRFDLRF
ncbi:ShlB/FhaC/HecB family hemolysin secretion/activation protein [Yersinia hibernica]|uniref:ShlB/FhaC/HecB family hemolysin secretion/activation protein n=1 Tax=Yersinia hibernica TaxID=2339259 RepID=A0ABX5QZ12_9GAMM|nr:ShlB/FhaC/HecB family hemolysin secretion/activation protein [Yersinia hibernica]QAX78619.1 ShlB/FhaC/HecB family hemolysin secretion/activation protein [Yersinia hibernica]